MYPALRRAELGEIQKRDRCHVGQVRPPVAAVATVPTRQGREQPRTLESSAAQPLIE